MIQSMLQSGGEDHDMYVDGKVRECGYGTSDPDEEVYEDLVPDGVKLMVCEDECVETVSCYSIEDSMENMSDVDSVLSVHDDDSSYVCS